MKSTTSICLLLFLSTFATCYAQPSPCEMHLLNAKMRLIPKTEEALNASVEDAYKYITRDIVVYAIKQAWNDYQTESRISHDKVCLAEWIAFVQGNQPSVLKDAGVPMQPDESRSYINDAMRLCAARLGLASECKGLKDDGGSKHHIEANLLAVEIIHEPSDAPDKFTFKLTNRSKRVSLFNVYFPLIMKDDKNHLVQKRAQLSVPELRPGGSVRVTMMEVPGWMDSIREFYKVNNIQPSASIDAAFGSISFRIQGNSQPSEYPFGWCDDPS
jgi:hypothetical protein